MASYDLTKSHTETWEGDFDNDPDDPGGATNHGIILIFWELISHLIEKSPSLISLKELTWPEAHEIYKATFWKWMMGDRIENQKVAATLLDHFINADERRIARNMKAGSAIIYGYAIIMMQRCLGFDESDCDGIMGEKTIGAINSSDPEQLFSKYQDARRKYYTNITIQKPVFKKYLNGWLKRVDALG